MGKTVIKFDASLGADAIILLDITIGNFALVGAVAVVMHSVPPHGIIVGNPVRLVRYTCHSDHKLTLTERKYRYQNYKWLLKEALC